VYGVGWCTCAGNRVFHVYGAGCAAARRHDIVHLLDTNFKLLKIKGGRIDIKNDSLRNSIVANMRDEDDVLGNIKKNMSKGFFVYSWSYNAQLFGYLLVDLDRHGGFVKLTSTDSDIVYIPVSSWLPWQRIIDQ